MVEQSVQTVPAEQVEQKGLSVVQQQGGEMGRVQRARAPAQRGELIDPNITCSLSKLYHVLADCAGFNPGEPLI